MVNKDWEILKGNLPEDNISTPRQALDTESFSQQNITYSQLIAFMFGEYSDKSGGLAGAEGNSFEKDFLRKLKERVTGKTEKTGRISLTNHHQSGQISMYSFMVNPSEPSQTVTASSGLISKIIEKDICRGMRSQIEIRVPIYSPRGTFAGTFSRRLDLLTSRGIYDIKLSSIKNDDRLQVEFTTMAVLWVAKRKSHRVFDLSARWRTTFAPNSTEPNSFGKISPNVKPIFAIVSPDGLLTSKSIGFNIQKAKETQSNLNRALLEMLRQKK